MADSALDTGVHYDDVEDGELEMMVVIVKMMAIVTFTLYNQRMILKIRSTSSIMIR